MLQAKISMPQIGKNIIRRESIEERLRDLSYYKFVFVSAPAGYGKTTAVVDFIVRTRLKYAWLSIDEEDNDPSRFWKYIVSAIATCTKREKLEEISLDSRLLSSNIAIDLLIDTIEKMQDQFVIVLDDYHLVKNEVILENIPYFIKYMPTNVHLIIVSRNEPDKRLSLLCAKGMAVNLNIRDLTFSRAETKDFFQQKGFHLTDAEVRDIERYTEGWPAGLVTASFCIEADPAKTRFIRTLAGKDKNIDLLLENEVFDRWPDEVKNFLICTSFLERLTGDLCNAVTETNNGAEILKKLSQSNGFVIPLDASDQWFRYHHLFQRFLHRRLDLFSDDKKRCLYSRAGEWYARNERLEDAIKWLLEAKKFRKAYACTTEYQQITKVKQDRDCQLWRSWIDRIPEEVYRDAANVFTFYSWVAFMNHEFDAAVIWAQKAWDSLDRVKEQLDGDKRAKLETCALFTDLNIDILHADTDRIIQDFTRFTQIDIRIPVIMGELNWYEPNLINGMYGFGGKLNFISVYFRVTDIMFRYMGLSAYYIEIIIAEYYYEKNKIEELAHLLIRYMGPVTETKKPGVITPAFIVLAKRKLAIGNVAGAFSSIEDAYTLLGERADGVWRYHLNMFKARLCLRLGEIEKAKSMLDMEKLGIYGNLSCIREAEYMTYARLLMITKDLEKALVLLTRLMMFAEKNQRLGSLIESLCLMAICYSIKGDMKNAMATLERALKLGSEQGYIRTFVDEGEAISGLLGRYIQANRSGGNGQYVSYAKDLFRQTNEAIGIMSASAKEETQSRSDYTGSLLSEKEVELLKLLSQKKTNKEIVGELFLSLSTVKQYNSRIYDKLGVKSRYEAVSKARSMGIIE